MISDAVRVEKNCHGSGKRTIMPARILQTQMTVVKQVFDLIWLNLLDNQQFSKNILKFCNILMKIHHNSL